jgi:SNF2 family DNA or RNA helicase
LISTLLCNPAVQTYTPPPPTEKPSDASKYKKNKVSSSAEASSTQSSDASKKESSIVGSPSIKPFLLSPTVESATRKLLHCALVLAPVNTLRNWELEFKKWMPSELKKEVKVYLLVSDEGKGSGGKTNTQRRAEKIMDWSRTGGVLILGYDLFKILVLEEKYYNKTYGKKGKENMDRVKAALCDPGTKRIDLNLPYS